MVSVDRIYSTFVQQAGSCILASYAIASNYFTGIEPSAYFHDYRKHFDLDVDSNVLAYFAQISYKQDPATLNEFLYDYHFHKEYRKRRITGLSLLSEIHKTSTQLSFHSTTEKVTLEDIPNVTAIKDKIIISLIEKECLLVSAFGGGQHIAVFGYSNNGFFTVETRSYMIINTFRGPILRPNKTGIIPINDLNHFGELGDAILISKK